MENIDKECMFTAGNQTIKGVIVDKGRSKEGVEFYHIIDEKNTYYVETNRVKIKR